MNPRAIQAFHKKLHGWYAKNGRHALPWRNTRDPYHIYISEIMLQQTQVKTVLERFYAPFLKRFPTLAALAAAPSQDVMKAWEGLGYYSRAANLHKAAKQSGGKLPRDVEGLIQLPGIGRNTAHAVAAFAYHHPVPVMEANVKRVLCRIFALKMPTSDVLWLKAAALLDSKNPYDYNQSMMDIGAIICTKLNPKCSQCPANTICEGQKNLEAYPEKAKKKSVPVRRRYIVVKQNAAGEIYLTKRTSRFLGGLYGFSEFEAAQPGKMIGHITQQYSHFTLEADVLIIKAKGSGAGWYNAEEAEKLPLSRADLKVLNLLQNQ